MIEQVNHKSMIFVTIVFLNKGLHFKPLHITLPKVRAYVLGYDGQTK